MSVIFVLFVLIEIHRYSYLEEHVKLNSTQNFKFNTHFFRDYVLFVDSGDICAPSPSMIEWWGQLALMAPGGPHGHR